jgi:hypothetical protein
LGISNFLAAVGMVNIPIALKAEIVGLFIAVEALRGQTAMAGMGFNLKMLAMAAAAAAQMEDLQALAAPEEIIV